MHRRFFFWLCLCASAPLKEFGAAQRLSQLPPPRFSSSPNTHTEAQVFPARFNGFLIASQLIEID